MTGPNETPEGTELPDAAGMPAMDPPPGGPTPTRTRPTR
jgi:hypothetical protein